MERQSNYLESRKIVFQESIRVVKRDPDKYSKIVLGIWIMPLIVRGTEIMKDAYFFMRHIDDVLDGDLSLNQDPLTYVEGIKDDIVVGKRDNAISVLAERSLGVLNKRKKEEDNPKKDFLNGIDGMIVDYKRMTDRGVLSENDLRQNYIDSFGPHYNISLIMIESDLRAKDIEVFSYCQGLAYGVRDFDIDWQRGLINVPEEILSLASLTSSSRLSEVRSNLIVGDWFNSELRKSRVDLGNFLEDINDLPNEGSSRFIFNSLSRKMIGILEESIF